MGEGQRHQVRQVFTQPSFRGRVGVARRDITPPVGIYSRNWGAAEHDAAEGIHRPLFATALALADGAGEQALLLGLDLGNWRSGEEEERLEQAVTQATGLDRSRIIVALAHTHAGPAISLHERDEPGGELITSYLQRLVEASSQAFAEALARLQDATITWSMGRCQLARHRDFFDGSRYACGFDPQGSPDDALLVGRVSDSTGRVMATLLNYACHPTTLGPANRLISPDYVGAAREVVERVTDQAPCLFLQGCSGDLGPREGFVGDAAIADRNGRVLGWSALAALEDQLPPETGLAYQGVQESGASLAIWRRVAVASSQTLGIRSLDIDLALKDRSAIDDITASWGHLEERVRTEREGRRARILEGLPEGSVTCTVRVWRIGDAFLVAQPHEAYSVFQERLRGAAAPAPVLALNLARGRSFGYLPPQDAYDHEADLYQVWQTPFGRGALEKLIGETEAAVEKRSIADDERQA